MARADEDAAGAVASLLRIGAEAIGLREHGVGEIRAVDLERIAQAGAGEHDGRHDEVVCESCVDASETVDQLGDELDVAREIGVELRLGELGERLHLEALVVVVDEHGQEAADVGVVDLD